MDIEYLLLLQNFRQATGDFFTPLMEVITELAAPGADRVSGLSLLGGK